VRHVQRGLGQGLGSDSFIEQSTVGRTSDHAKMATMSNPTWAPLSWREVAVKLATSRSYWLVTTNADGSPHSAPVWGVMVDDRLYIHCERKTVKARNLARDGRAVVHLESGEDVVIIRGYLDDVGLPEAARAVMNALSVKYDHPGDAHRLPSSDDSFDVLYLLRPVKALLWNLSDYEDTQQRWTAEASP
jgi:Pyridoxamine 5'-phosphate oxidase